MADTIIQSFSDTMSELALEQASELSHDRKIRRHVTNMTRCDVMVFDVFTALKSHEIPLSRMLLHVFINLQN